MNHHLYHLDTIERASKHLRELAEVCQPRRSLAHLKSAKPVRNRILSLLAAFDEMREELEAMNGRR